MTGPADLHLIERRPRVCRLARDEVAYLLALGSGVVQLVPTADRGYWRLTPAGVVGVLHTPRRRMVVSPKVALCNILFLLEPSASLPPMPADDVAAPGDQVVRLLVGRLITLMQQRASAGLHRGYREQAYQGSVLQGRLDVPAQMRRPAGRRDQLHSRVDAFTADIPCNQVPRAVAGGLLCSTALDAELRGRLGQALAAFAEVSDVSADRSFLARLDREREPEGYGPLLDLCRILKGIPGGASQTVSSLLVSLERLFERYLSRTVEEGLADRATVTVRSQAPYPAGNALVLRPDVTIEANGRPVVVIDAKWKRLPEVGHLPEDVYQALAYAAFLEARRAILVYPGQKRFLHVFAPPGVQGRAEVRTLNVSGPLERCRRSRERFQRHLKRSM